MQTRSGIPLNEIAPDAMKAWARINDLDDRLDALEAAMDRLNVLDKSITAIRKGHHASLDKIESWIQEQQVDRKEPALDPFILGLAMAYRATRSFAAETHLRLAYYFHVGNRKDQTDASVDAILRTYGLEES